MSETENKEIVSVDINEDAFIAEAQKNTGFSKDESIIPFTRIMQPLSPQVNSVPGAVPGSLLNIASGNVTDGKIGMNIIPITHQWNYTEWVTREEGGGFVADWGDDESGWQSKCDNAQKFAYKPITNDGHAIVKARHFFVFNLLEDGTVEPSLLPFTGTALKIARQWSSMMQNAPKLSTSKGMMTPAYFYYVYNLTAEEVKNNNYRWFEPRIKPVIKDGKYVSIMDYPNGKEIWQQAISFRDNLKAGTIKAARQDDEVGGETEDRF
jgi:hypothetical protein